jgi:hypothetical protein
MQPDHVTGTWDEFVARRPARETGEEPVTQPKRQEPSLGVEGAHGGNLQIATVNRSGQIHFLTPFNGIRPLTSCRVFWVQST